MYLHKTKNGHYTPPCCYFSGELEVVEILRVGFCCKAEDDKDVNQWLMRYWQLANGNFVPRSPDFGKMYIINDDTTLILKDIEMNKHKTICINDSSKISNFEKTKSEVLRAFEKKFPQKSNYEL